MIRLLEIVYALQILRVVYVTHVSATEIVIYAERMVHVSIVVSIQWGDIAKSAKKVIMEAL